jgi:hypothetical protein
MNSLYALSAITPSNSTASFLTRSQNNSRTYRVLTRESGLEASEFEGQMIINALPASCSTVQNRCSALPTSRLAIAGIPVGSRDTVARAALCLFALAVGLASSSAQVQTREWGWMGGSSVANSAGVYGTMGTPSAANVPSARSAASYWTDSSGNFWLFGGFGFDANGNHGSLNDLWEFNPSTEVWTWMGGSSTAGQPGAYGQLASPSKTNIPGGRYAAASWTDVSGNFWLFGGSGFDSAATNGLLNDLWEFSPSTGEWTWRGGSSTLACNAAGLCGQPGAYGELASPSTGNLPGGRYYESSCADKNGNLWLFGGYGLDSAGAEGSLNDLWEFNPANLEWAWMSGSDTVGPSGAQPGTYGTLESPAAANVPGGRYGASCWNANDGNFWLFGGEQGGEFNDLWEFDLANKEWAWMGGSDTTGQPGVTGSIGHSNSGNIPGSRQGAISLTDSSHNFWLFGGTFQNSSYVSAGDGILPDFYSDIWEFDTSTLGWTWWGGSNSLSCNPSNLLGSATCTYNPGVYAVPGTPGGRYSGGIWIDGYGNFWLFGGAGADSNGNTGDLNDVWLDSIPTAAPVFSLSAGTYAGTQSVTITDGTAGAMIYFTTDGTTPTTQSALYNSPVPLTASTVTLQAIAVAPDDLPSTITSAAYNLVLPPAAAPVFTPGSGVFSSAQVVTITDWGGPLG